MKHQTIWITSDTHYGHANMVAGISEWKDISRCRPFITIDEMNDVLVTNINNVVKEQDLLFHLGDWSLGGSENIERFRKRLHVKEIHLITGNHNAFIRKNMEHYGHFFHILPDLYTITIDKTFLVLCHYPLASWEKCSHGSLMLHGHIHSNPLTKHKIGRILDIGIDGSTEFRPYNLREEIIPFLKNQPISNLITYSKDYHN